MIMSAKEQTYQTLCRQIECLISGEKNITSVLANVASALHFAFPERFFGRDFIWFAVKNCSLDHSKAL